MSHDTLDGVDIDELVDRVPEGWSAVVYAGRRYGLVRRTQVNGRAVTLRADELGGTDLISANVYRTTDGDLLKPCEMPAQKVLDFLAGWSAQ